MVNFEKLSFENIEVTSESSGLLGKRVYIKVLNDDGEILAEANCNETDMNDFTTDWFYSEILEPEINDFFFEILNNEERKLADNMDLEKYIAYINDKCGEDETSTLNKLYKTYVNLNKYNSSDIFKRYAKCVRINSINANYEKTGAGTLIVDYLKEKYELIFLYATSEVDGYFLDKANFKEILNGFMYWSENEKLNEIL